MVLGSDGGMPLDFRQAKRKYTDEQIVTILPEHAGGVTAKEVIRSHRFSLDTFCRWKGSSHPRCWNPHT